MALKVNQVKSSVSTAAVAGLLGFGFYYLAGGKVGLRVHAKTWKRLKQRLRQLTDRSWGISMRSRIERLNRFIAGWAAYFTVADGRKRFEAIDKWLRRRLRTVRWKQWKRIRTKYRNLIALGIDADDAYPWACTSRGYWRVAGSGCYSVRCPTATGTTSAWKASATTGTAAGTLGEPPYADPHVRWCGRGRRETGPDPIFRKVVHRSNAQASSQIRAKSLG